MVVTGVVVVVSGVVVVVSGVVVVERLSPHPIQHEHVLSNTPPASSQQRFASSGYFSQIVGSVLLITMLQSKVVVIGVVVVVNGVDVVVSGVVVVDKSHPIQHEHVSSNTPPASSQQRSASARYLSQSVGSVLLIIS